MRSPTHLLFSRINCPSCLRLSSYVRCTSPLPFPRPFTERSPVFLVLRSPELNTVLQVWPYICWVERKDHLSHPAASAFPYVSWDAITFFCKDIHCWLLFNSMFTKTLSLFLESWVDFLARWPPAQTGAWGCYSPRVELCALHFWAS